MAVSEIIVLVSAICVAACRGAGDQRERSDSATRAVATDQSPVDPARVLALQPYFAEDRFKTVGGTCIKTDPEPGRSRILYAVLPSESTYVRLNVVSVDGRRLDMIELVRGVSGGGGARIWTAMTHGRNGQLGPIVTELFASASDKAPTTTELPVDGAAGQVLQAVAAAAMKLPCGAP
jgi:hypothetical protein